MWMNVTAPPPTQNKLILHNTYYIHNNTVELNPLSVILWHLILSTEHWRVCRVHSMLVSFVKVQCLLHWRLLVRCRQLFFMVVWSITTTPSGEMIYLALAHPKQNGKTTDYWVKRTVILYTLKGQIVVCFALKKYFTKLKRLKWPNVFNHTLS